MKAVQFIAKRISGSANKGSISAPIVKIAVIGIIIGVAVMDLTVSIVYGFKKEIAGKITGLTADVVISNVNINTSNEPSPVQIAKDTLNLLQKLNGVMAVQPTAFKNGILKTETENEGIILKGVNRDYNFTFINKYLIAGRLPEFNDSTASKDILISKNLSEKVGLSPGDKMQVYFIVQHEKYDSIAGGLIMSSEQRSRKLTVCGIFNTGFSEFDNNLSFVDLKQIQKLNYWNETTCGNYEVKLMDEQLQESAKENIEQILGYNYSVNTVKTIYANIFNWLDKLDVNGIIVIVLMVLVAVVNMITALLILILERTNMIGLLKSLGMNNTDVRKVFLQISLKLVGKGLLYGNLLGIGMCYLQYYFKLIGLDSDAYYVDHVVVDINWNYYLILNAGTLVVCVLMLYIPSMIVSKLTPVKTLRFD